MPYSSSALALTGDAFTGARWRAGLPPGVYEQPRDAQTRRDVRLDTAAFLALAERGPVGVPVVLRSWSEFASAFGRPMAGLQGPLAVRLFFANGGRQCVFVRCLDEANARAARLALPGFAGIALNARNAGAWGNRLLLRCRIERRVLPLRLAAGNRGFADGTLLAGADRAVPGTTLRLAGDPTGLLRHIVDASRPVAGLAAVTLAPPLAAPADPAAAGKLLAATEELTLSLDVVLGETLVESWSDAALHPFHPDHLPRLLARPAMVERFAGENAAAEAEAAAPGSQFLRPDPLLIDTPLLPLPELLTAPDGIIFDAGGLVGTDAGFDAADTTSRDHFLAALDSLARYDEASETAPVALVALPDLAHTAPPDAPPGESDASAETCFGACIHAAPPDLKPPQPYLLLGANDLAGIEAAQAALVVHCESHGRRIALLDLPEGLPSGEIVRWRRVVASARAAVFAPWLRPAFTDETGTAPLVPPAAAAAGLIARVERETGVHASPGAQTLQGVFALSDAAVGLPAPGFLHEERIDLIRPTEKGLQLMGSRTTSLDPEWTHLSVRRLFDWLALQLAVDLAWAPFEPNDAALWRAMVRTAERRLDALLEAGALAGAAPADSYFVRCDRTTMSQGDLDFGRATMLIGVAPAVPCEFLTFTLVRHGADDPRVELAS